VLLPQSKFHTRHCFIQVAKPDMRLQQGCTIHCKEPNGAKPLNFFPTLGQNKVKNLLAFTSNTENVRFSFVLFFFFL